MGCTERYFPAIYLLSCSSIGILFLIFNYSMNMHIKQQYLRQISGIKNSTNAIERTFTIHKNHNTTDISDVQNADAQATYDAKKLNRSNVIKRTFTTDHNTKDDLNLEKADKDTTHNKRKFNIPYVIEKTFIKGDRTSTNSSSAGNGKPESTYNTWKFNTSNNDVLVFLHIEKTGGSTFENMLLADTVEPLPCKCTVDKYKMRGCDCKNSNGKSWLFSRKTSAWSCGVHPDLTQLKSCVPQYLSRTEGNTPRRLHFFTILRDPYFRYLSEWLHVQRGTTWRNTKYGCSDTVPDYRNLELCHGGAKWSDVSLKDFLSCPHNPASNRQTWMLASLDKIGCDRLKKLPKAELKKELLESAKMNLKKMAFFGLQEFRSEILSLFGKRFNIKFKYRKEKEVGQSQAKDIADDVDSISRKKIHEHIDLDIELYNYAKKLYKKRYNTF